MSVDSRSTSRTVRGEGISLHRLPFVRSESDLLLSERQQEQDNPPPWVLRRAAPISRSIHELMIRAGYVREADIDEWSSTQQLTRRRVGRGRDPSRDHPSRLDAFYASVEQLRRPELRGLPVIVGGAPSGDGGAQLNGEWSAPLYERERSGPLGDATAHGAPALPAGCLVRWTSEPIATRQKPSSTSLATTRRSSSRSRSTSVLEVTARSALRHGRAHRRGILNGS